jgi:hypothetical protein
MEERVPKIEPAAPQEVVVPEPKKQNYFQWGLIVVVILVLALAAIVYSGISNKPAHKTSPVAAKATAAPTKTPSPSPTPSPGVGYLVITQWGVSLPASGNLSNLQYKIENGSVLFYSSEIYPKYQLCGEGGLGSLSRVAVASDSGTIYAIKAGTLNGYDYYYSTAQQPCVQGNPAPTADEQVETNQMNTLAQEMRALTLMTVQ